MFERPFGVCGDVPEEPLHGRGEETVFGEVCGDGEEEEEGDAEAEGRGFEEEPGGGEDESEDYEGEDAEEGACAGWVAPFVETGVGC